MDISEKKRFYPEDGDRLMTLEETGERLGTGRQFVSDLVKLKFLPAVRFGRQTRISKYQLNEFIGKIQNRDIWNEVVEAKKKLKCN